ncbi:SUMF1/EgtB/PvdO family nonheme iron enzyme [Tardiphaga sp.]|uniref:SUMF1/EgtB/PvdO family nonheme iron enzyme n=1 Tax=Tardiphaga sp. TaxID=1926292 RepID=UPI00262E5DC2|nr:SUMF1/EgtB/PvdO family nonheme iron enzyme [Tardiphaga sp.]MDB5618332.1 hypothetical protein [Tardiphaga sp.]
MRGDISSIHPSTDNKTQGSSGLTPRRLAVIVVGDIVGYSRLMELDEEGTHARVKRIERDLIEPTITEHSGRLVKTTGDGFIAIFDSPVEAVRCGIVIQQSMVGRNASQPKPAWMSYRIGVNLGDVIIEDGDVYGDGVNIAARLEGLAEPGQVYISGGVYEQIKHKIVCGYESLGDRKIKNITDPVRVYRVLPDPSAFNKARRRREGLLVALLTLMLLVIASGTVWFFANRSHTGEVADGAANPGPRQAEVLKEVPPASPRTQIETTQSQQSPAAPTPSQAPPQAAREPEMIALPGGTFAMGSNDDISEKPVHKVTIKPFAIGARPVTVREWNECAIAKACALEVVGSDDAPATNVSWSDAKQYVAWLSRATRKPYRLPTEAEWEYAARGGTQTKYWWGDESRVGMANCKGCSGVPSTDQPGKVGAFKPNPFGLYDMGGTVDQWVEDCGHRNYQGAPIDGSAWVENDCGSHVLRSGSWKNDVRYVRPSNRDSYDTNVRYPTHGLRIAISP